MRFDLPHWLEPPVSRIGAASIALGLMCAGAGMQFAKRLTAGVLLCHAVQPFIALGAIHAFGL